MKRICVCGLGKLGACIAAAFASSDVETIGLDTDQKKVAAINEGNAPVSEPDLADYIALARSKSKLRATGNPAEAVAHSDACLFVTPTPSLPDGSFDHSYLLEAMTSVAREAGRRHKHDYLYIVNSTTVPGFMLTMAVPLLVRLMGNTPFKVSYKPEFIALGSVISGLHSPDMLLIGSENESAGKETEALYRVVVGSAKAVPAKHVSLVEAELAKITLNCAVTMKISFANQVGLVASRLGADPNKVLGAVGEDHRVGHDALRSGLPFGGPCFPRDNRMFQHVAGRVRPRVPLAEATDIVNRHVLRQVIDKIPPHGEIGILGLTYKPGTSVTEESAGTIWQHMLRSQGRKVKTYDPVAPCQNNIEDVMACSTVIVACAWPQFENLDFQKGTMVIDPFHVLRETQSAGACR